MTPAAIAVVTEALRLGVTLRHQAGQVIAKPKNAVTSGLAVTVQLHRAEVIALLAHASPPPTTTCWSCRGARFFARPERLTWICGRCHPPAAPTEMVWQDVGTGVRDG